MTAVTIECTDQSKTESSACSPETLLRPRFFDGQILNDSDLTALLTWTQGKFELNRHRAGWGVVCGLEVGVDSDGKRILVTPGYAIDSCGHDIIVCSDDCHQAELKISDICRILPDDCNSGEKDFHLIGYNNALRNIRVVDIYLRYQEEGSNRQTALGRNLCRDTVRCEATRTRETYQLCPQNANVASTVFDDWAQDWNTNVDKKLTDFFGGLSTTNPVVLGKTALWDKAYAMKQSAFRFVLDQLKADDFADEGAFSRYLEYLFWIAQDCLEYALAEMCAACHDDKGVPLARVWLQTRNGDDRRDCRALWVENHVPYRRPLQPDSYPAPVGRYNLGRFIGRRYDEVYPQLRALGFTDIEKVLRPDLSDFDTVKQWFLRGKERYWLPEQPDYDQPLFVNISNLDTVVEQHYFGQRVLGFSFTPKDDK